MLVTPALKGLRQEDHKFDASLPELHSKTLPKKTKQNKKNLRKKQKKPWI
jgi:hypothetical protein